MYEFLLFVMMLLTLIVVFGVRRRLREMRSEISALRGDLRKLTSVPRLREEECETEVPLGLAPDGDPEKSCGDHAESPAKKMAALFDTAALQERASGSSRSTPPPLPQKEIRSSEPSLIKEPPAAEEEWQAVLPVEEKEVPAWVESTRSIIQKIWSWILVGDEHRPEGVTVEYAIATTWLLRIGILAIVCCAVYFLKWSIERDLISDIGRVAICIMAGISMLAVGIRLLGKKYHIIGQGLLGGGLLVLYYSVYAASPMMYDLVPMLVAFGLMILVTATAGFLSVRTDSLLIAIIAIAGAYTTPLLLQADALYRPGLYSYILLISLGILGIAHYKQWRLLNYLGFVLTYALFIYTLLKGYDRQADCVVTLSFLSAVFIIHSAIVYLYNILKGNRSTVLEIVHLSANALIFSLLGYGLILDAYGRPYPAVLSISLALFFILHVFVFLRKRLVDRPLLVTLIALTGLFTAWTLPLVFENESLTISLSLLALTFMWIGQRLNSHFLQTVSHLTYLTVFVRLLLFDLGDNFSDPVLVTGSMAVYWKAMSYRLWTFGTSIASITGAFLLQRRKHASVSPWALVKENDTPELLPAGITSRCLYWFAVLFGFLFLHLEMNNMLAFCPIWRLPVLTLLWCLMTAYFLWRFLCSGSTSRGMFAVMCVFLVATIFKLFSVDVLSWHFSDSLVYGVEYRLVYVAARFLDFGVLLLLLWTMAWLFYHRMPSRKLSAIFGYSGLLLFFIYSSLECNTLLHYKQPDFCQPGISILWALFAIGFISGGIWKNIAPLRHTGLLLFLIVVGKIFLHDLSGVPVIYKVIAFMVLGVTLLLGSFAYIFGNKKFQKHME